MSDFSLILTTLNSFILLYFFHTITNQLIKYFKISFSKYFFQILLFFLIISFVSVLFQIILILDYKFFFSKKESLKILIIAIIYLNLAIKLINFRLNSIFNFLTIGIKNIWIYLFLIIFFLCSLGVVSDADSLIYHSKVSKIILAGFQVNYFYDNPHYLLVGSYEIFNILPEILGISNFNTLLNSYFLLLFIKFVFEKFSVKKFNSELFILLIISTPVISIILTPQKSFFIPIIIQFLAFTFILYNKKFLKFEYFIVLSSFLVASTFKLNFVITSLLLFIFFIFNRQKFNRTKFIILCSTSIFVIYLIPHYIFKIVYFDNPFPPFLNSYLNTNTNNMFELFSEELKEWKRNSVIFPFSLFINIFNGSFSSLHNSLGIGILSLFFIKRFNNPNLKIIILFLVSVLLFNFLLVQNTPRFYFLPLMISFLLILEADLKKFYLLKKIIFLQYFFTILALLFLAPTSLSTTFLNSQDEEYKKKFIFRYAVNKKINEIVGENKFILIDLPNYYSKNYEISTMILSYISNENELKKYKEHLNNNDVKYFFSVNFPIQDQILKNRNGKIFENFFTQCFENLVTEFSYDTANRKRLIFNKSEKVKYFVYKKNINCKFK